MRFRIDKVLRSGTKNSVVYLENGEILKVPVEQAVAGTYLDFDGQLDQRIREIPVEYFHKWTVNDLPPSMLDSMIY